jgi:hypothetical protein
MTLRCSGGNAQYPKYYLFVVCPDDTGQNQRAHFVHPTIKFNDDTTSNDGTKKHNLHCQRIT